MRLAVVWVALAACGDNLPGHTCVATTATVANGYPLPGGPAPVVVGDIYGDGHPTVIIGDGPLELFAVGADGSLVQSGRLPLLDDPLALALIDIDGDRIPEIVAVSVDAVFVAKGTTLVNMDPVPFAVVAAAAGDLDGDGVPELVIAGNTELQVLRFVADGTLDLVATGEHVACVNPCPIAIGDVDGDGHADVVIDANVLRGHGDGTLDPPSVFDRGGLRSIAVGKVDGRPVVATVRDGVVVPANGVGSVAQLAPAGGTMLAGVDVALPGPVHPAAVAFGDIDGDGEPDMVVAYDEGPLSIASILSHGTQRAIRLSDESPVRAILLADLDGDGQLDVVETTDLGVVPIKLACADAPACATPDNCPAITNECGASACTAGACDVAAVAEGTPVTAQTAGDCQINVCNGFGGIEAAPDGSDVPADQPCFDGSCVGNIPTLEPVADGTSCGAGAVCESGTCLQQGVLFVPDQGGPIEGRVVDDSGAEVGRCALSAVNCLVPTPPGHYTVEVASPWGVGQLAGACQTGSLSTCDVTVTTETAVVASAIQPTDSWVFLGDPGEVFDAVGFDAVGDVFAGSATRVIELDPNGGLVWSVAMPASSIAVGANAIYALSGSTLVALDLDGNFEWQAAADACPAVAFAHCLAIAPDGDIVFGGPRVMRFAPDGTLRWQTSTDPAWVDASVGVSDDDVTYLLQADATSGGVTAARFTADGTRLADFVDDTTRSLGAPNASLTVTGTLVVVASSTATIQSIRFYDPTGHETHGADVPSANPHGVASAGGIIADAIQGFPDLGPGFSAFEDDASFNAFGHSLSDNATTGLAHVIGDTVENVAVSSADGSFVVAGSYAGLGTTTVGWIEASPPAP